MNQRTSPPLHLQQLQQKLSRAQAQQLNLRNVFHLLVVMEDVEADLMRTAGVMIFVSILTIAAVTESPSVIQWYCIILGLGL